jgi:fibronectin-binding autotransporter adhesin
MKRSHSSPRWSAFSSLALTLSAAILPAGAELTIERTIADGNLIPDRGNYAKIFTWENSGLDSLSGVVINVNLSSPDLSNPMYLGDLYASLTHGTAREDERMGVLFNRPGVSPADPFGDDASSLSESYNLSDSLAGDWLSSGRWTLFLSDSAQGGIARLDNLTLTLTGSTASSSSMVLLGGDVISGSSQVTLPVTLSSGPSSQIVTANIATNDTLQFSGGFSGSADLVKQGGGKLSIDAQSGNFTGGIQLNEGTLELAGINPLGSEASISLAQGGAQLRLADSTTLNSSLILSASGSLPSIFVSSLSEGASISSDISGVGGFEKTGSGMLTLSGNNSHSGLTKVSEGYLQLTGSINSSDITVSSSATFALDQDSSVGGNVFIEQGGLLTGSGSFNGSVSIDGIHVADGLQTFNNGLSFGATSNSTWQLATNTESSAARGIDYTGLNLTAGDLEISAGSVIDLVFLQSTRNGDVSWIDTFWDENRSWMIVSNSGTTTGIFTLGSVGADSFGLNLSTVRQGAEFSILQNDGDIYLTYLAATVVPEPSLASLIAGFSGLLLFRRRR